MPAVLPHNHADIFNGYFNDVINKRKWVDIAANYRNYMWTTLLDVESRFKQEAAAAHTFQFSYMVGNFSNGQWDQYFNPDTVSTETLMEKGTALWSFYKNSMVYDRRQPGADGSGLSATMIWNELEAQRANYERSIVEDMETAFWTLPPAPNDGSGGASIRMNGVPYMIVKTNSQTTVGPHGGNPTGYSSVFGKNRTNYPRLRNYAVNYSTVSHDDLILKMEQMTRRMRWQPARIVKGEVQINDEYEIISHDTPLTAYQQLLRDSNENLGTDAAKYYGRAIAGGSVFKGIPWNWSDAITSQYLRDDATLANPAYDSSEPVYMFNWNSFELRARKGWFMKPTPPERLDNPHNTVVGHTDSQHQLINILPSANAVLSIAA